MNTHPHAEVLRAIADGVPLSDFDASLIPGNWHELQKVCATNRDGDCGWIESGDKWEIRRKPQHIMVNGFKVPKPLDSSIAPKSLGTVYWPYITYESLWDSALPTNSEAMLAIQRGCAHATKEAATAHAKAMLGIDPEYFK